MLFGEQLRGMGILTSTGFTTASWLGKELYQSFVNAPDIIAETRKFTQ